MTTMELERVAVEVLPGGRVRSDIAKAHLQWVRDYHGEHAIGELFALLPHDVAHDVRGDGEWIAFASLIALDRALDARFGRGRRGFLRELGRYSAHLNLSDARRTFRGEAVHDFLRRVAFLHARFQDFGSATYEERDMTSGRVVHADYRCFSPVYCASAAGYYEQLLVTLHAIPVRVDEVSCQCRGDAHCTFELQWK